MRALILLAFIAVVFSCSGNKKQTLAPEKVDIKEGVKQDVVADFSSTDIFTGERKDEIRRIDPAKPPVIIDISGQIEKKELDMVSYFPEVKFIKLKHPKSDEGKSFKTRSGRYTSEIPSMNHSMTHLAKGIPRPTFLSVVVYKSWILVGGLSGLFCYDKDGNYLHTLLECNEFDDTDMSQGLNIDMHKVSNMLAGFSVMNDICAFVSATDGKATLHFFDLNGGTEVYRKSQPMREFYLLNGKNKTLMNYTYNVRNKESRPFMYTLTAAGDTLCGFYNKNIFTDMTGMSAFHNPGSANIYNYDDRLHVKQQGNDTLYCFRSEYEINPAYIFKAGTYGATIQDIIKGKLDGKRSVGDILETDRLLLFSLRGSESAFYYDKTVGKVYESSKIFTGSQSKMLPTSSQYLSWGNKRGVYDVYVKQTLTNIIKNKDKSAFSSDELATVKKWDTELNDNEVLLMLME